MTSVSRQPGFGFTFGVGDKVTFNPLCTNKLFCLIRCNKLWMVKCIYREVKSYNFFNKFVFYFCEDRLVLAISVDPDKMVHTAADCQSINHNESPVYKGFTYLFSYVDWLEL